MQWSQTDFRGRLCAGGCAHAVKKAEVRMAMGNASSEVARADEDAVCMRIEENDKETHWWHNKKKKK
ncbi:hypothetical protein BCR44DRAFT_326735 [Catenaria anguillulae PL171]|uniref:Uncharacterized protein n=1 Tax=Catenaria anguillulae PL171 TaxID=765915 RepID=A0A1Y2H9E8_9FUNG|nr:hypothetical protein BCR44DRAFT_326735 [Catenaria anguillulae PL171]